MIGHRGADIAQMTVAQRIYDRDGFACRRFALERFVNCVDSTIDVVEADEPNRKPGLTLQHAPQIGIAHRIQRVVLHRTLGQQHAVDKQMPGIDGPSRRWES